jgi:glycosyltransferase involved in cell wall biosynthesis
MVDGETGLLVPPADPDGLAASIAKLLQSPEMAAEMGAAGRRRVIAQYRVETMARRVEELYDTVLGMRAA